MPKIGQTMAQDLQTAAPGRAVLNALETFLDRDSDLLRLDANERSMTHRLAMYLQEQLPLWHVDCEYNRDGHEPKRLEYFGHGRPDVDDTDAKTVYPDIIAHHRDTDDNYLVIELKKTSSSADRRDDYEKLRAYRSQLGYEFALFIEFQTGPRPSVAIAQWIDNGERC